MSQLDHYVTLEVAAERLGLCTKTVRRMIAEGELPAYRVGKRRATRIRVNDINAALRRIPAGAA